MYGSDVGLINLILFYHYYRYKQVKQVIKDLIDTDNLTEAKTKLDSFVIENNNYIIDNEIPNEETNFSFLDNLVLNHGKIHLDSFVQTGQSHQKPAAADALSV